MSTIKSINPCNEQVMMEFQEMTLPEITSLIDKSNQAFMSWKELAYSTRASYLKRVAQIMLERKTEISRICALEMGKPTIFGDGETEGCVAILNYYADNGEKFL